jgi:outer membrane protein OmpA-like peptidoglycan-associated protein
MKAQFCNKYSTNFSPFKKRGFRGILNQLRITNYELRNLVSPLEKWGFRGIFYLLLSVILIIASSLQLFSQTNTGDPIKPENVPTDYPRYGIYGSFNLNQHNADFRTLPGVITCCPKFIDGSGTGFGLGLLFEYPIADNVLLAFRAGYLTRGGKFQTDEIDTVNVAGQAVNGIFRHTIQASLANISIEPMLQYRFWDKFLVHGGFQLGLGNLQKSYSHSEEIIEPAVGTFENNQRTRLVASGDIQNLSSFKLSLLVGLSYEMYLNEKKSWILAPEIFYTYGLLSEIKDSTWKINMLRFGLSLKYSPQPEKQFVEKKIEEKPPALMADVSASGVDNDGKEMPVVQVRVEEFLSTRMNPLLTYVFFDENSSTIPDRYKRVTKEQADKSTIEQFHNFNALETYYNLLNIVGKRMQMYPDAKIVLDGCNSNEGTEKNNIELSKKRAEAVKDYLTSVWSIDPSRIQLNPRNLPNEPSNPQKEDGVVENRRVEILSNTMEIIAPIITDDTLRVTNPPVVRFRTDYKGESPLRNWTLLASQKGKTLKTFSGDNNIPNLTDWIFAHDEKSIPRKQEPLNYQLIVHDNAGQLYESPIKTLPVEVVTLQKKRHELFADKLIDRFSLILFTFDETKLTYFNTKVLEIIQSYIKPESEVKVYGYTDRMGEPDYNLKLSQQRAQGVANKLKSDKKTVTGIGANDFLYDNNLPEGRYYCRRVDVIVETPIEFK